MSATAVLQQLPRSARTDLRFSVAALLLGSAAAADLLLGAPSHAEQATQAAVGPRATGWLRLQQPTTASVQIQPSSQEGDAGLGLFASTAVRAGVSSVAFWRSGWWSGLHDVRVAAFSLDQAISAQQVILDSSNSAFTQELLQEGIVDSRQLIMLFLIVQRLSGDTSDWAPWIAALPDRFTTPPHFRGAEMDELMGTTLHRATRLLREQLQTVWRQLEPVCETMCQQAGAVRKPTYHDFKWAYSIFWSRAQSFDGVPGLEGLQAWEGIIPGLDFCNHAQHAPCRWAVEPASSTQGPTVSLVVPWRARPVPGTEVLINYGRKSNEELLLLYGFAEPDNEHDQLMVPCVLPDASQWDEGLQAKMVQLHERGLRPQLFLPHAWLQHHKASGSRELPIPPAAWETLAVLTGQPSKGGLQKAEESAMYAEGLRLAVLTSFIRLLELREDELEDVQKGTGSLDSDLKLLQEDSGQLSGIVRSCIIYRAAQKRIARMYLQAARTALGEEMQRLRGTL